jgi:1,2-beta-oligoglucan phosphorylase
MMKRLVNHPVIYPIQTGEIKLNLLETGDVFYWTHGEQQINLLRGNPLDGMIANLYLREKVASGYRYGRLLGIHSPSQWTLTADGAIYQGTIFGVDYTVHLIVESKRWVYQVQLNTQISTSEFDLFYGQDIGIAHPFGILSNEAYTSQYINHQIFHHDQHITLLSRQNQGKTHFFQMDSDYPTIGFSTDAMQFFGLNYKLHHHPQILNNPKLPNQNYQYEFAYPCLQTQSFRLTSQPLVISFSGYSHLEDGLFTEKPLLLPDAWPQVRSMSHEGLRKKFTTTLNPLFPLTGLPASQTLIASRYPTIEQIEQMDNQFLSGFLPDHTHVVSQAKELLVERPHGHILLSGDVLHATENVFATTAYMMGIFGSHTVYGNTNFHKLTGDLRQPLNLHTISGTRIYLEIAGNHRLLGLPSLFEMQLSKVTWVYVLDHDILEITLTTDGHNPESNLSFKSLQGKTYNLLITQQLLLDTNEYQHSINLETHAQSVVIFGSSNRMILDHYPELKYRLSATQPYTITLLNHWIPQLESDAGMLFFEFNQVQSVTFKTEATLTKDFLVEQPPAMHYEQSIKALMPLTLTHLDANHPILSFNHLLPWYIHDALVHYASPHGLEQYNGAAWGTRDVLQGPFELFLAAQKFDITKEILLKVFARQFDDTHDFPQWFMFDHYRHIQAHESHGDVIVWPLKALASYVLTTGDVSIFNHLVPYMNKASGQFTTHQASIADHVWAIIQTIEASFIPNTHLPAYGGGDWDDTLQPANPALTKQMVSGWTVALLYEALKTLSQYAIFDTHRQQHLGQLVQAIYHDYHQYMIVDGVPAGFVIFYPDHREVLLHPHDQSTGLNYRLLPFNRGMIAHLFSEKDLPKFQHLIRQHLRHPDGVRLMNTSVRYQGGKRTYFQRAETAANFGREIGIQYVHAHIRYIEAMCVIGDAEEAWWGLNVINPITMHDYVPRVLPRQRNVYFSSSDANFLDRYEAKRDFEKVRQGSIPVKAGWRLYSSGPGIYLATLILKFLGIRIIHGQLAMDPMNAAILDGVDVHYIYQQQPLLVHYEKGPFSENHHAYRKKMTSEISKVAKETHVKIKG